MTPPCPRFFPKLMTKISLFNPFFCSKKRCVQRYPSNPTYTILIHCFCAFKPQIKSFSSSLSYNIKYQLFPKPTMWANVTHPVFEYLLRVTSVFSQRVFGTYEEPTDVINNLNILNIRREHCPRY